MAPEKNTAATPRSLGFRLSMGFFLRQLIIFASTDFVVVVLAMMGLFLVGEHNCAQVIALVEERGIPATEVVEWMAPGGYAVEVLDREPQGTPAQDLPWITDDQMTQGGLRVFDWKNTIYAIEMHGETENYAVTVDMGRVGTLLTRAGLILLAIQIFSLVTALLENSRAIRRTLRPIQDLADTAQRLNSATLMSKQEMETLTGQLHQITATQLDSRINLPATQKELRSLAREINQMLDRVNRAYSAQMQFVSDASHELRTPIAVIQGYAALLDRWGKSDPQAGQEAIDAIRSESQAMEQLMEQLLFLARGDNDTQPIEKGAFSLTQLGAETLRETAMIHGQRTLLSSWTEETTIEGDPVLIKRVIRILLDNSIKYSPQDSRIWLKIAQGEDCVRVTVQDEGMGIPAESLPHIFDRFYRADASRTRQTGGTGLGLSIARWIVERHGGWFEVISGEELGSRICFVIPNP